jgi:uncharacterized protein (DUF58 family)
MATTRLLTPAEQQIGSRQRLPAQALAAAMPRLVTDARRAAASVVAGVHGRRRSGPGETFWQFRPFSSGEPAARVDWRRSARDDRLYVREREWEAAQTVWIHMDRSPSMAFQSSLGEVSKLERALVMGLATGDMLVRGGERVGLLGAMAPVATRRIIERMAEALVVSPPGPALPVGPAYANAMVRGHSAVVLISDFIVPVAELEAALRLLGERGARGALVMIVDPAEELFPFSGQTEFEDPEDGFRLRVGDAGEFAAGYHERVSAHRDAVRRAGNSLGWTVITHRTDRPAAEALLSLSAALASPVGGA